MAWSKSYLRQRIKYSSGYVEIITIKATEPIVAFTSNSQDRQGMLIKYADAIGGELIEVNDQESFIPSPNEFNWLAQLVWGQQLALELAEQPATNPDTVRRDQRIYANAGKEISL